MGTRGTFGVRVDQKDKLTYNHYDSYPEGLGESVVKDLHNMLQDEDTYRAKAQALVLVEEDTKPTAEQKELLKPFTDLQVGTQSDEDWYCVLRGLQGELKKVLDVGFMNNSNTFIEDSLFCEYGYIVNFDAQVLELYRGFVKKPGQPGRYTERHKPVDHRGDTQYYPSRLVAAMKFELIKNDLPKALETLKAIYTADDTEREMDEAA